MKTCIITQEEKNTFCYDLLIHVLHSTIFLKCNPKQLDFLVKTYKIQTLYENSGVKWETKDSLSLSLSFKFQCFKGAVSYAISM